MKILKKKNIVIRYPPLKLRHQRCVDAITVNQGQEYFLSIDNNRRLNYSFKLLDSVTQCSSTTTQKQCGK